MREFMEAWGHYQGEKRFSKGSPLHQTYWEMRAQHALESRCEYWIFCGKGSRST